MEPSIAVTYSNLDAHSLMEVIWPDYALSEATDCYLLRFGLNDHYLVTTAEEKYILRVYHTGWRTNGDIAYELSLLTHLHAQMAPVCAPMIRRDGEYVRYVPAPEGPRAITLFPFAHGHVPDPAKAEEYHCYGRALAQIHQSSDGFTCPQQRFPLDIDHFTTGPVANMLPHLAHRPDDYAFVTAVAEGVCAGLTQIVDELEWGPCHGDFHGGNAYVDAGGNLRVFDFDCCGQGWRAYDIAVCRWGGGKDDAAWEAFLQGYHTVREIPDAARAAIPWFIVARQLWLIGLHTRPSSQLPGRFWLSDQYFDNQLGTLRELITKFLPALTVAV